MCVVEGRGRERGVKKGQEMGRRVFGVGGEVRKVRGPRVGGCREGLKRQ